MIYDKDGKPIRTESEKLYGELLKKSVDKFINLFSKQSTLCDMFRNLIVDENGNAFVSKNKGGTIKFRRYTGFKV